MITVRFDGNDQAGGILHKGVIETMTTCSRFESMNEFYRRMLLLVRIVEESVFGDIYRFERIVKREELMRRGVVEND